MASKKTKKNEKKYYCKDCDYCTSKKTDYSRHLSTGKHKNASKMLVNASEQETTLQSYNFVCNCGKTYQHDSSYYRHKKKCPKESIEGQIESIEGQNKQHDLIINKELIVMILKQNQDILKENTELKNMMLDAQNQIIKVFENGTHNTTTNSHNKTFNLNVFLNETCKDAMNLTDFIDSLHLEISDLEKVGELGYIQGISNIIIQNLNALDVTQRPVHCTDKKREIMFIKDQNEWIKETPSWERLHKMVKKVSNKNINLIQNYKDAHPDCMKSNSKYSDQFNKIIVESMGGTGDNDFEKEEKIIKKIAKEVVINKDLF